MQEERREFQRLHLTRAVAGSFGAVPVRILDVSATGALVEHDSDLPSGAEQILRFVWRDSVVTIPARVARGGREQAGLEFTDESDLLRKLIAESAKEVLQAQVANMEGSRAQNVVGDETLTAASMRVMGGSGYTTFTYVDGQWKRRKSLLPDQPPNGFTISSAEAEDQIEVLCRTYENGDEQARNLTRLLAELSCATVRGA